MIRWNAAAIVLRANKSHLPYDHRPACAVQPGRQREKAPATEAAWGNTSFPCFECPRRE
jgi:hypothetical protein